MLRHGEPVGGKRYRGNGVDDPLSEIGWRQMQEAVAEDRLWSRIITSPLQRCQAFARELSSDLHIPLTVEDDLVEIGFGTWEGKSHDYIQTQCREEYLKFRSDPVANRPQGAEPLQHFVNRIDDVCNKIRRQYPGEQVLLVAHAGVIRAVLSGVLHVPITSLYEIKVDYAARVRIRYDTGKPVMDYARGLSGTVLASTG